MSMSAESPISCSEGGMTFRERLRLERPYDLSSVFCGGCCGCPCSYGYEVVENRDGLPCSGEGGDNDTCTMCWDREIPGTETVIDVTGFDPFSV